MELIESLIICNAMRFTSPMLANRTIHEFAWFVDECVFGKDDSDVKKFYSKFYKSHPINKSRGDIEAEFNHWGEAYFAWCQEEKKDDK